MAEQDILQELQAHILRAIRFWFINSDDMNSCCKWEPTSELEGQLETPWDRGIRENAEEERKGRYRTDQLVHLRAGLSDTKYEPLGSSLMVFGKRFIPRGSNFSKASAVTRRRIYKKLKVPNLRRSAQGALDRYNESRYEDIRRTILNS
jgi:hypothetical protein